jgi:chromosome partitioning protein
MKGVGCEIALKTDAMTVHRDANTKGLTAQELEPDSRAAAEVAALWEWISAELQISTNALVHREQGVA